jgi:outer membrane protein OmpA-like peptidoglycan-associated protein
LLSPAKDDCAPVAEDAMKKTHDLLRLSLSALLLAGAITSCAEMSRTAKGGAIGTAAGGVIGGVIGHQSGNTAKGTIIGAVLGGAAGALIGHQMDQQARELKQNIPGATVERVGEGIQVTFASGLLFDFDSDVVKGNARANLDELARSLDKYDGSNLLIVGHTDDVGAASYNQDLSERRADAARRYLVSRNVDGNRIDTRGVGEDEPVTSNATESGRARNRRVEVAIYASEAWRDQAKREAGS